MLRVEADADRLPDAVVVVAGHQGEHVPAARELERVQEVRPAEHAIDDAAAPWRIVVMHDVVRTQQHVAVHFVASRVRSRRDERSEFRLQDAVRGASRGKERRPADEACNETRYRPMVQLVGRGPLLEPSLAHEADPVGQGKRFLLVVCDDERGHPQ